MDVAISLSGGPDADAEIRSLFHWLQREEELPEPIFAPAAPGPQDMGAVSDVLVVALGSGGAGAMLANSMSVWARHRGSDLKVTFRGKKATVQVEANRIKDPVAVVRALRDALGE